MFMIPGRFVKNGDERLVALNDVARSVVEARRGQEFAFKYGACAADVELLLN